MACILVNFGVVNTNIAASSDAAFRRLIGCMLGFYAGSLSNSHRGEQIRLRSDNALNLSTVLLGPSHDVDHALACVVDKA